MARPQLSELQIFLRAQRRYLSTVRVLAAVWRHFPFLGPFLARLALRVHPQQVAPAYAKPWPVGSWNRYLTTASLATALLFEAKHLFKLMRVEWRDPKGVLELLDKGGGVLLTFHHPLAYLFPALVGSRGIHVDVLARSPEDTPVAPLVDSHLASWFRDTQRYFSGGEWCFQFTERANDMRRPLLALRHGKVVVSLHDFPNIYPGAQTISGQLLGRELVPAEGIIGPALRRQVPIALGYVQWLGGSRFAVTLDLVTLGDEPDLTSGDVLSRYLKVLESILVDEPEFWEAWGGLPFRSSGPE